MAKKAKPSRASRRGKTVGMAHDVFLSHSSVDKWVARALVKWLKSKGVDAWFDEARIDGGDSIPDGVFDGVKRSRELLVLMTPACAKSEWVKMEVAAALSRKRRVTAILYHVDVSGIPVMIKDAKAISLEDMSDWVVAFKKRARSARK